MTRHIYHPNHSTEPDKVVWKYTVPLEVGPYTIVVPTEAKFLHAEFYESGFLKQEFALWYEIPHYKPGEPQETREHVFQVFGTGDLAIPHMAKQVHTGVSWDEDHRDRRTSPRYVWHLYEFPGGTKVLDGKYGDGDG